MEPIWLPGERWAIKVSAFVGGVESAGAELVARKSNEPEEEMRDDVGEEAEDAHPDAAGVAHGESGGVRWRMVGVHPPDLRQHPENGVDNG